MESTLILRLEGIFDNKTRTTTGVYFVSHKMSLLLKAGFNRFGIWRKSRRLRVRFPAGVRSICCFWGGFFLCCFSFSSLRLLLA